MAHTGRMDAPLSPASRPLWPRLLLGAGAVAVLVGSVVAALAADSGLRAAVVLGCGILALLLAGVLSVAVLKPLPGYRPGRERRPGQGVAMIGGGDGGC